MPTLEEKQGGPAQLPLTGSAWTVANPFDPASTTTRTGGAETLTKVSAEGWRLMIRRMRGLMR